MAINIKVLFQKAFCVFLLNNFFLIISFLNMIYMSCFVENKQIDLV